MNFSEVLGSKFKGENKFSFRFWGQVVNFRLFFIKNSVSKIVFSDTPSHKLYTSFINYNLTRKKKEKKI